METAYGQADQPLNIESDVTFNSITSTTSVTAATVTSSTGSSVGGATAGAGGLAFPATQVAVADANTLDDYEEGTWTPVLEFGGASVGITYVRQLGTYTKTGRKVTAWGFIQLSSKGSSTGASVVTGNPFIPLGAVGGNGIYYDSLGMTTMATDVKGAVARATEGGSNINLQIQAAGVTSLAETDFNDTSFFAFTVTYFV